MANYIVQEESLEIVADSIRAKAGISEKLEFPLGWKAAVDGIAVGGGGDGSPRVVDHVVNFGVVVSVTAEDIAQPEPELGIEYQIKEGGWYLGESSVLPDPGAFVTYYFPVEKGRTYTITMVEIGNRLRCGFSNTDPSTLKGYENVISDYRDLTSSLSVGYEFTYTASANGWYLMYVSNAGTTPAVSVTSD